MLWLDKVDRTGRIRFQTTELDLGIQSRLDGMKDAANKSDMERHSAVPETLPGLFP